LTPVYEPDEFRFRFDRSSYVNLHNIYRIYVKAPRGERAQLLANFVRGIVSRPEIPGSFAEVRPLLLPVVRPRALERGGRYDFSRD
jgi:hypothetical protein